MNSEPTVVTTGGFQGGAALMIMLIVIGAAVNIFMIVCWCKIVARMGYSWALGLLQLIPLVGLVHFMILAFSKSPNESKIRILRRQIKQLEDAMEGGAPPTQPRQSRSSRSRGQSRQSDHRDEGERGDDAASALGDLAG